MSAASQARSAIRVVVLGIGVLGSVSPVLAQSNPPPAGRPQTVAERFGFDPREKLLIVHADDAGMCHAQNRATIDAFERKAIRSASIMVPCPWVLEIVEYAKAHPEADFGVHLTLNSEWKHYRWRPVTPWDKVKGLLDAEGYLAGSILQTATSASGAEVEAELRAQVRRALDLGLRPTHLDTHMGTVFARPDYFAAYRKVAREFGLPCMIPRLTPGELGNLSPALLAVAQQLAQGLFESGDITLDHLERGYAGRGPLADQKKYYLEVISRLTPGITQIILHPAFDGDELSAITAAHERRYGDFRAFTDLEVAKLLREKGVRTITWREIGQRQADYRKRQGEKPQVKFRD